MTTAPEPCLRNDHGSNHPCHSPVACGAFGYCRERNFALGSVPDRDQVAGWRADAARRKIAQRESE